MFVAVSSSAAYISSGTAASDLPAIGGVNTTYLSTSMGSPKPDALI
jgi:hypothetical protein